MDSNNIFTVTGDTENYRRTIKNEVNLDELKSENIIADEDYKNLSGIYKSNRIKCWGFQDNRSKQNWEKMSSGDLCLMYRDKKIVMAGFITYKFESVEVAEYIWKPSDSPFKFIFCLKEVSILNLPSKEILVEEFGYESPSIRGALRLADNRRENLMKEYGTLENFKKEIERMNEQYDGEEYPIDDPPDQIDVGEKNKDDEIDISIDDDSKVKEVVNDIKDYIAAMGFTYPEGLIENFYLSLKSRSFVLLAGISGTGKTQLVKQFANAIGCTRENGRFKLVSVRPDWSDTSDLLGYTNIKQEFQKGPVIDIIKKAVSEAENYDQGKMKPYIVCLDEMNLARVEYYFSDFLSVMETREFQSEKIVTDELMSTGDFGGDEKARQEFAGLYLPDNLYIVGTVNMDETTHPFSKKVLDRANTIEFNRIDLMNYSELATDNSPDQVTVDNSFLSTEYLKLIGTLPRNEELVEKTTSELQEINDILAQANLHVGYRVRDEINFYIIYNERFNLLEYEEAFDYQILQKILPKIQGSSRQLKDILVELYEFIAGGEFTREQGDLSSNMRSHLRKNEDEISYNKSAKKIVDMMTRYEQDGFTAYWL